MLSNRPVHTYIHVIQRKINLEYVINNHKPRDYKDVTTSQDIADIEQKILMAQSNNIFKNLIFPEAYENHTY